MMRIRQREEVVPITLVETGQWRKNQDGLRIPYRVNGGGEIVEMVMNDGWRRPLPISLRARLLERRSRW